MTITMADDFVREQDALACSEALIDHMFELRK
jgi:hypothetical protein